VDSKRKLVGIKRAEKGTRAAQFDTIASGLRVGIASWAAPVLRLSLTEEGVTVGPLWRCLSVFLPTYTFRWDDTRQIVLIVGWSGSVRGFRFVLAEPARAERQHALAYLWPRRAKRVVVYLRPNAGSAALAFVPSRVPTQKRQGFTVRP
jgi:hypothetical protein